MRADRGWGLHARDAHLFHSAFVAGEHFNADAATLDGLAYLRHVAQPLGHEAPDRCRFRAAVRPKIQKILQPVEIKAPGRDESVVRLLANVAVGLVLVADLAE